MRKRLILGPPGTGKTTRLLDVVDQEMAAGTPSSRIAYISFTRKATYEAQARAIKKFSLGRNQLPFFKTIHSICYSQLSISKDQTMQRDDYLELGKLLGIEFTGFYSQEEGLPTGSAEGDKLLFIDSYARATRKTLEEAWHEVGEGVMTWQAVKQFSDALAQFKRSNALIDFTDMLELFLMSGGALPIDVMVIDEAQDLSTLQWEVVRLMYAACRDVYIAGDDDQAIYKWSGADVEQFLHLDVDHREVLKQSYRLPRAVHSFVSRISDQIIDRYEKEFLPNEGEGKVVRVPAPSMVEVEGDETWLFLARNVHYLKELEQIAHGMRVVYECRGRKSVSEPHVRAIQAWERLRKGELADAETIRDIYKWMKTGEGVKRGFKKVPDADENRLYSIEDMQEYFGLQTTDIWHEALRMIPAESRAYYLSILRAGRKLTGTPQVVINTIHGVKGGEADNVLVLCDMAYRTFREYEENPDNEHRVFYVAASRAKQALYLVEPRGSYFYTWD